MIPANLALFDPASRHYERWPARMWTQCAISGTNAAGEPQEIDFMVDWAPELVYAIPGPDGYIASPLPAAALTQGFMAEAQRCGANELNDPVGARIFDGYYYDPAAHVVRTYQQDIAEATAQNPALAALLTNRPPAPAALVTV